MSNWLSNYLLRFGVTIFNFCCACLERVYEFPLEYHNYSLSYLKFALPVLNVNNYAFCSECMDSNWNIIQRVCMYNNWNSRLTMPSAVSAWILTGTSFKGYVCITTGIAYSPCVHYSHSRYCKLTLNSSRGIFFPAGVVMMTIVLVCNS